MKIPDVSNLEQAVIGGLLLRCEYEGGAIWDFWIDISMKSQVDHAGMAERELLEVCLCRLGPQKNRAWFGQISGNRLDLMTALRQRNKLSPLRPRNCSVNAGEQSVGRSIGCPGRHPDIGQIVFIILQRAMLQNVKHSS